MIVYLVFENDYDGSFLDSVWSTEALAEARITKLQLKRGTGPGWSVEPYAIDSGDPA